MPGLGVFGLRVEGLASRSRSFIRYCFLFQGNKVRGSRGCRSQQRDVLGLLIGAQWGIREYVQG